MNVKLRKLREKRDYNQDVMAEVLGISQPQYHRKESGISPISEEEEWNKLAAFFGVPIHDIQDYANNMITNNVKKGNSYTLSTINYSEELVSELKSHNETLKNQNQHLNKIIIEKDEQITLLKSLLEK